MEIKYLGWQSFRIQQKGLVVLTQPFSEKKTKVSFPKTKADLVLQSRDSESSLVKKVVSVNQDKVFWVPGPGEYEAGGIEVRGFSSGFWFKMRNFQLAFWWDLDLEKIKKFTKDFPDIDILLLKSGQGEKGAGKRFKEIVRKVSPAVLLPFCPETVSKTEVLTGNWAKPILDVLDQEDIKPQEKLTVSQEEVSAEELKVVLLKPKL